MAFLRLAL